MAETFGNSQLNGAERTRDEIAAFLDGLDLLDPGIVPGQRWRPDGPVTLADEDVGFYGAVGRKR